MCPCPGNNNFTAVNPQESIWTAVFIKCLVLSLTHSLDRKILGALALPHGFWTVLEMVKNRCPEGWGCPASGSLQLAFCPSPELHSGTYFAVQITALKVANATWKSYTKFKEVCLTECCLEISLGLTKEKHTFLLSPILLSFREYLLTSLKISYSNRTLSQVI